MHHSRIRSVGYGLAHTHRITAGGPVPAAPEVSQTGCFFGRNMSRKPRIEEVALLPGASRRAGVPRSTVQEAIKRGEIVSYPMADGTSAYCVAAIIKWKEKRNGKRTQ